MALRSAVSREIGNVMPPVVTIQSRQRLEYRRPALNFSNQSNLTLSFSSSVSCRLSISRSDSVRCSSFLNPSTCRRSESFSDRRRCSSGVMVSFQRNEKSVELISTTLFPSRIMNDAMRGSNPSATWCKSRLQVMNVHLPRRDRISLSSFEATIFDGS